MCENGWNLNYASLSTATTATAAAVWHVIGAFGTITKGLFKGLEHLEDGGWVEDYPNESITENGQNPETSPGDLRRLAVTQTPVRNHQLKLM